MLSHVPYLLAYPHGLLNHFPPVYDVQSFSEGLGLVDTAAAEVVPFLISLALIFHRSQSLANARGLARVSKDTVGHLAQPPCFSQRQGTVVYEQFVDESVGNDRIYP